MARLRVAVVAAILALVSALLCLSVGPASAAVQEQNNRNSRSSIYTRPCLDFSSSRCALVKVAPGNWFPGNAKYAMPGYGWRMCHVAGDTGRCISGSTYVDVSGWRDFGVSWIVKST